MNPVNQYCLMVLLPSRSVLSDYNFLWYGIALYICSLLGPAKVNKIKIFSGPCYMIKRVLTFVSGV